MGKSIKVRVVEYDGVSTIYPVCYRAKAIAAIAGTKTIPQTCIKQILSLGFGLDVEPMKFSTSS
jgi:hypothetical protein